MVTAFGTDDVIAWRPSAKWAFQWLAFHLFVLLPFLALAVWAAANSIAGAPAGTWPAYLFFLGAFATLVLATLIVATLVGVFTYVRLLFDRQPIVRADRHGLQVRMPLKPLRIVRWQDISAIQIERTRRSGRTLYILNHLMVLFGDEATPDLVIKPQMAGVTLEDAHAKLCALLQRFR